MKENEITEDIRQYYDNINSIVDEYRNNDGNRQLCRPRISTIVRNSMNMLKYQLGTNSLNGINVIYEERKSLFQIFKKGLDGIEEENDKTVNENNRDRTKSFSNFLLEPCIEEQDLKKEITKTTEPENKVNNCFINLLTGNSPTLHKTYNNYLDMIIESPQIMKNVKSKQPSFLDISDSIFQSDKSSSKECFMSPTLRPSKILNSIDNQYSPRKSKLDSLKKNLLAK
jgi:hypothetical protein